MQVQVDAACEGRDPEGSVDRVPHEDDAERDRGGEASIAKITEAGGKRKVEASARAMRKAGPREGACLHVDVGADCERAGRRSCPRKYVNHRGSISLGGG